MKTGLIMEGGAMRGMFTCGVIDVLMGNSVSFDGAAGISAGAVFGCNYKSGQIGRPIRYNKQYCRDPRYCSFRSLISTGDLYGADFCYRELPDELDPFDRKAFSDNPMDFFVGATDVKTGKCVYHNCLAGDDQDFAWMRASASMPLVSRPVKVDGYELLDGGISDAVPYRFMEDQGFDRNVIILTQPKGYRKKKNNLSWMFWKYPKIAEAMKFRHEMYNQQMDEIDRREGDMIVIRPPGSLNIGRTEKSPDELERVYQIGRKEAERRIGEIQRFLSNS